MKKLKKSKKVNNEVKDFSVNDLPHNRREVFFDVVKQQWRKICVLGIILLLFSLPLFGLSFFVDFTKYSNYEAFIKGTIDETTYSNSLYSASIWFIILLPICMVVLAIGLSGMMRIIKRLCYLQPVFLFDDFKKGVKQNFKLHLINFLFFSLINALVTFLYLSFKDVFFSYIPYGLCAVFIYPCFLIALYVIAIYNITFSQAMKLSFKMYFRTFILALPFYIVVIAPAFFFLINDIILKHLLLVTYSFITPFSLIFYFLFISWKLDILINKTQFPELVDKGIVRNKSV